MLSLLPFGRAKRTLVLAATLGIALASLGVSVAAHSDEGANASAGEVVAPRVAAGPLDDSALARQRGGRPGTVTVAAMPDAAPGSNSVTLWDELARPAPAPVPMPVDTTGSVRSNAVNYTRK